LRFLYFYELIILYNIDIILKQSSTKTYLRLDLFLYIWQFYHHVRFEQSLDALTPNDNGDLVECPESYQNLDPR